MTVMTRGDYRKVRVYRKFIKLYFFKISLFLMHASKIGVC